MLTSRTNRHEGACTKCTVAKFSTGSAELPTIEAFAFELHAYEGLRYSVWAYHDAHTPDSASSGAKAARNLHTVFIHGILYNCRPIHSIRHLQKQ